MLVELRDQASLAAVVAELGCPRHPRPATCITPRRRRFAGIPVSVASATCYTQDLNVPVGGTRGRDGGQAFNLVHVYEHTVVHSVVPLGATADRGRVRHAPRRRQRRLAAAGIRIPEAARFRQPPRPRLAFRQRNHPPDLTAIRRSFQHASSFRRATFPRAP